MSAEWPGGGGSAGAIDPSALADDPGREGAGRIGDGEVVILDLKPHPLYVVLSALPVVVMTAAIALPMYLLGRHPWAPGLSGWVVGVATLVVVGKVMWQALDWWNRRYVLTDRRVVRSFGVLRRFRFEAPLRNLQHVEARQSVLERVFGLGSIAFATAGTGALEAWWLTVDRPVEVLKVVRETVERYGGRGGGLQA